MGWCVLMMVLVQDKIFLNGHESMLDLTFVSENIGNISLWKVIKGINIRE